MELFYSSKWPERNRISWCEITLAHLVDSGGPLKVSFDRIPSIKKFSKAKKQHQAGWGEGDDGEDRLGQFFRLKDRVGLGVCGGLVEQTHPPKNETSGSNNFHVLG